MVQGTTYILKDARFDFSGTESNRWNAEYERIGENFLNANTAYVHIYDKILAEYEDNLTVIQYHYFYPYNHWWNNHEGDWQRVDVVIDSSEEEVIGVEYRFHSAHLSYYKDYTSPQGPNPFSSAKILGHRPEFCCVPSAGLTDSFVFNPRTDLKLSQGTHPIVYVGAGSHATYPVGGKIKIYHTALELLGSTIGLGEEEVQGTVGGDYEYMTHMGLVLSTQADGTHNNLWENYKLVVLPDPDTTNTNNMGLDPAMSWLGARIRWGTPQVSGPIFSEGDGNESPKRGPYNSETDGWGDLKVFHKGHTGPGKAPYYVEHKQLPYENYHHWAILGDETWSGTVNLTGDVVVFPGATLTIEPGTVVTFSSQSDRHQFKEGNHSLSEIFVYGTLESKGTGSNFVSLGGGDVLKNSPDRWGGIQVLGSGSLDLGDWTFFSNINPAKPRFLGSSAGDDWVSVRYDYGGAPFILEGKFTYETRLSADGGTTWSEWSGQALLPGQMRYEDTAYEYREEGLREVTDYLLSVGLEASQILRIS